MRSLSLLAACLITHIRTFHASESHEESQLMCISDTVSLMVWALSEDKVRAS